MALSKPHVCHPSESSGSSIQVCAHSCTPSRTSALRKACVVCHKSFCVPDHVCRDTLPRAYGCPVLLLSLQSNLHRCEVLRNFSQCTWISALSEFSSCLPSGRHDVCSSKKLVLVHLFEDFHALQEIELFLTSLLLGRHCHVLVSLEKTFRRRLRR